MSPNLGSRFSTSTRGSNGHETSGEYVQTIGGHSYCTRCLAAMLDAFGARVRDVEGG